MVTKETSGMRELTAAELEDVTGAMFCATGEHIKTVTITVSSGSTGSYWGTDEAAGEKA